MVFPITDEQIEVGNAMRRVPSLYFEKWESVREMLRKEPLVEYATIGPFVFYLSATE